MCNPNQAKSCGLCLTETAPPEAADRPLFCVLQTLCSDKETPPIWCFIWLQVEERYYFNQDNDSISWTEMRFFFHCLVGVPSTSVLGLEQVMPKLEDFLATWESTSTWRRTGGRELVCKRKAYTPGLWDYKVSSLRTFTGVRQNLRNQNSKDTHRRWAW